MNLPVIILGAGGHAKVLIDALRKQSIPILGITEKHKKAQNEHIKDIEILGDDEVIFKYSPKNIRLVNGLGSVKTTLNRQLIFEYFKRKGYVFTSVIHPNSIIASDVLLLEGVQIMAGAIIQSGAKIGMNTILNTRASIDHDCIIGDHVHLAPGVVLSGGVTVGYGTHIGVGATVIQGITIGTNALISAGSLVIKDVMDESKVMGVPAKEVIN
ncbi:MAG: acetyltransferase [Bacillota bacterium]